VQAFSGIAMVAVRKLAQLDAAHTLEFVSPRAGKVGVSATMTLLGKPVKR